MSDTYRSFEEYWPEFVRQHENPRTRALHAAGAGVALGLAVAAIVKRRPLQLLIAPVVGYAIAWSGHVLFERNRPTSLDHPLYAVAGNLKMIGKMLLGQMSQEAERIRAKDRTDKSHGSAAESTTVN
jgi:hypothetical protein